MRPNSAQDESNTATRLVALAAQAERARPQALKELRAGQKQNHWVWWVFPTIASLGGDMNSALQRGPRGEALGPTGADLRDVAEAAAYISHPELRTGLVDAFTAAAQAMAAHKERAPWHVLDAGFGRASDGAWIRGPVDAYKVRCCATLFAAVAHMQGDAEVRRAAVATLHHFTGDVLYTPGGEGTAGHVPGFSTKQQPKHVLDGPDVFMLELISAQTETLPFDWSALVVATGPAASKH